MGLQDKWIKIGLVNLSIVAFIGVVMRYKIGFEFPYFDQKYLQHGHSHFAFAGWISHLLYVFFYYFLSAQSQRNGVEAKYKLLINANLVCAYGMLIAFILQGYGMYSIFFSSTSVLISFVYAWNYIRDVRKHAGNHPSVPWMILALLFNVLSCIGTFALAYMMATKHFNQHLYLGSVYFYLHFQYSGWFFFGCMGLFLAKLNLILPNGIDVSINKKIVKYFGMACLPAFLLSVLWAELPWYIYIFAVAAVLLQFIGLWHFIRLLKQSFPNITAKWPDPVKVLYALAFAALVIKLTLQAGSTFPEISKLAFGFRSIVIAYLHLVLLGIITLFLLGYIYHEGYFKITKSTTIGLSIFCFGVFLNEFILMVQGVCSFSYMLIPYLNEALFMVSVLMFTGLISLVYSFGPGKMLVK